MLRISVVAFWLDRNNSANSKYFICYIVTWRAFLRTALDRRAKKSNESPLWGEAPKNTSHWNELTHFKNRWKPVTSSCVSRKFTCVNFRGLLPRVMLSPKFCWSQAQNPPYCMQSCSSDKSQSKQGWDQAFFYYMYWDQFSSIDFFQLCQKRSKEDRRETQMNKIKRLFKIEVIYCSYWLCFRNEENKCFAVKRI